MKLLYILLLINTELILIISSEIITPSGKTVPSILEEVYLNCPIGNSYCKAYKQKLCSRNSKTCNDSTKSLFNIFETLSKKKVDIQQNDFCSIHDEVCDMIENYDPPLNDNYIYNLENYLSCNKRDIDCIEGKISSCETVLSKCYDNYPNKSCDKLADVCNKLIGKYYFFSINHLIEKKQKFLQPQQQQQQPIKSVNGKENVKVKQNQNVQNIQQKQQQLSKSKQNQINNQNKNKKQKQKQKQKQEKKQEQEQNQINNQNKNKRQKQKQEHNIKPKKIPLYKKPQKDSIDKLLLKKHHQSLKKDILSFKCLRIIADVIPEPIKQILLKIRQIIIGKRRLNRLQRILKRF